MPVVHSLNKTMKERIDEFYGNASVYRPNKFLVGLYGEYVRQAIKKLKLDAKYERTPGNIYNGNIKSPMGNGSQHIVTDPITGKNRVVTDTVYQTALDRWLAKHYNAEDEQVELKWTCTNAEIPSVQTTVDNTYMIDSIKSIQHPLVTSATKDLQQVKIGIMEDRNLMMYQFFNALLNRFYTPQILKPRSSFHKLGMYIAVLQEDFVYPRGMKENGKQRDKDLDSIVSQIFEFNSVVLAGIPTLNFNNKIDQPLTYSLSFYAPNTFQGSFKTSFKGLRNNSSDSDFLSGVDAKGMDKNGQKYIRSNFEIGLNNLRTTANGVYEKTTEPE